MSKTVIEHVLSRLRDTGIKDVFGVAGDFSKRLGSPYRPGRSSVSMSELRRELPSCKGRSAAGTDD
jgi:hypothetical protein